MGQRGVKRVFRGIQDRGLSAASRVAAMAVKEKTEHEGWLDWERDVFAAVQACIVSNGAVPHSPQAVERSFQVIHGFPEFHQKRLRQLLALLEASPLVRFRKRFTDLNMEQQTRVLKSWSESRVATRRAAFHGLKSVSMMGFWTGDETWPHIGYSLTENPGVPARMR